MAVAFSLGPADPVGTIVRLRVFPVKSAQGLDIDEAPLLTRGLGADRSFAVVGEDGGALRAKDFPPLGQIVAQISPDEPDALRALGLRLPGRTEFLPAGDAADALTELLGVPARVAAAASGEGSYAQRAPLHLVSTLAPDVRANIAVHLTAGLLGGAKTEPHWRTGFQARLEGGGVIELSGTPKHCSGAYAVVRAEGTARVGDRIFAAQPG